ncbi:hypothetical protein SLEP1_g21134 [Rubroshorea leprosula]|uniref:Uncharacterized protein n=1 Tax=Rubroshorea leprosula TaxID=152421 RepID=A0AAV5J867_9ROSI|nr:hypothetical protein SLEP1_g21134 [Rubroshorea leprosula]
MKPSYLHILLQTTKKSNFSVDFDYHHFHASGSGLSSNAVVVIVIACLFVFLAFIWCLFKRLIIHERLLQLLQSLYNPRRHLATDSHSRPGEPELSSCEGPGGSPTPAAATTSPNSRHAPLSPSRGGPTPAAFSHTTTTTHQAVLQSELEATCQLDLKDSVVIDVQDQADAAISIEDEV